MTRRRMLASALASGIALGQRGLSSLSVTSDSGLTIEPFGDPQRPAVALFLPDTKYPAAVIEMPEHAWSKRDRTDEPTWFYRMYSTERGLRGEVKWSSSADTIGYVMTTPSGFRMVSRANLQADGVAITHKIQGPGQLDLAAVQAPTCVKLYRPFTDVFLERTYVHHREGLDLIASETPERLMKNAEEWLPCRYIVNVGKSDPPGGKRVEHADGVTRYFKSRAADVAFIATESQPSGWVAATHGLNCPSVFTNPARTCQHADPEGKSVQGAGAVLKLKLYMLRGTVRDAWERVEERDRAGLV